MATIPPRQWFLRLSLVTVLGLALPDALGGEPTTPPNVLWIWIDDANMDLGTFGHPVVQTPNLDRIAARGVCFDQTYCPYPLCGPSRLCTLSGVRPNRLEFWYNDEPAPGPIIDGNPTLPLHLRSLGYQALGTGKVHALEDASLWDQFFPREAHDPWIDRPENPVPTQGYRVIYWGPYLNGPDDSTGRLMDTKTTDHALDMLDTAQEPFFLSAGYFLPHTPFIYPERFHSLYDPSDVPPLPPEESTGAWKDNVPLHAYASTNFIDPAWANDPEAGRREATVAYWRSLTYVDEQIGRLLDRLEARNLDDNTIIVVASDHGLSLGQHDRWDKFDLFEQSMRTPMIVSVPWLTSGHGQTCSRPVELLDLYPTLMDQCGLPTPGKQDGMSLTPLLTDPSGPALKPAFGMLARNWGGSQHRMVRHGKYKYVFWEGTGQHQLYDLETDPGEYYNLMAQPGYRDVERDMRTQLERWGLLQANATSFGLSLPGTLGVPRQQLLDPPRVRRQVRLRLENSVGEDTPGFLYVGDVGRRISFGEGVLNIYTRRVIPLTVTYPYTEVVFDTPRVVEKVGTHLVTQLLQTDPGAPGGVSFSRGLRWWFWLE